MSLQRRLTKAIKSLGKLLYRQPINGRKRKSFWLFRTFLISRKNHNFANAGFVLPTVAMVSLVVVLLTTAILFRSFERSKNASNVRVNEITLKAAAPALDRARAKINELFADPTLPRAVPSNATLYNTFISKLKTYTLGDEVPLKLAYDINNDKTIGRPVNAGIEEEETLETAWKFPLDTDNNGKFDSFILYSIYFRNPTQKDGNPIRARKPLDARAQPIVSSACDTEGQTSASLVGNSGWYKLPTGELKKSFFVYSVTVPISDEKDLPKQYYEKYRGNKGFSALELQQDRMQLPITNNAVVYEDDLDITPGPRFRINGRVFTNSNLFTAKSGNDPITFFQVSSPESCYYERENGRIIVGGNIAGDSPIKASDKGEVTVHLFKEDAVPTSKDVSSSNKSTNNPPNEVAYNSQAYAKRIDFLVKAQLDPDNNGILTAATNDPQEVQDNVKKRLFDDESLDAAKVRKEELEVYFRKRTRRVPFKEVPYNPKQDITEYTLNTVLQTTGGDKNTLRPPDEWMNPSDANTKLILSTAQLEAKDPEEVDKTPIKEDFLGDRISIGNNLPQTRWEDGKWVTETDGQNIPGVKWKNSNKTRQRFARVKQLSDLGATQRDGFWEKSAAIKQSDPLDVVGGLRVITGAGVYSPVNSNLAPPPTKLEDDPDTSIKEDLLTVPIVWPDTMPMSVPDSADPTNLTKYSRGHLVMRATAVYHYKSNSYDPLTPETYQKPIACVSNYYDPTNKDTARNISPLPDISGEVIGSRPANAKSNNGVSYSVPSVTSINITRGQVLNANKLFTTIPQGFEANNSSIDLLERLKYQANLAFPNGRFVNPLLRQALSKSTTAQLTLSEQSALDSTICALKIADGSLTRDSTVISDGTIKEITFLDARQVKTVDADPDITNINVSAPKRKLTGKYDLAIEQRQPLEIRATVIDLDKLRKKTIGSTTPTQEYLLPNSGIIYASRDDIEADSSDKSENVSATDYKLDPQRRPNAIMLINGDNLSRVNNYRPEEKGLILATSLPVYVQGNFNKHNFQEFTDELQPANWDTKFYTRLKANRQFNFACRPNDPRLSKCTSGETWRPASVIADAVTLLSPNFRPGFRDEGDYDLRNNEDNYNDAVNKRLKNGFWDNNFVTSKEFKDVDYLTRSGSGENSSYFNNFVTPIQRRVDFPEYVMEMCFNVNISQCGSGDWYVGLDLDGKPGTIPNDLDIKVKSSDSRITGTSPAKVNQLVAGTTAKPAMEGFERFPRRLAFKRNSSDELLDISGNVIVPSSSTSRPIPLGIKAGKVDVTGSIPDKAINKNALWFANTNSTVDPPLPTTIQYNNTDKLFYSFPAAGATSKDQPVLEPVIQLQVTTENPKNTSDYGNDLAKNSKKVKETKWLPPAEETTFNLVIAGGDTPSRVGTSTNPYYESNGGLHNFVRFLENWDKIPANISGSFIQFKRSIYATAPFQAITRPTPDGMPKPKSIFNRELNTQDPAPSARPAYNTDSTIKGEAPYYMAPNRNWGFDVGLLSQNPDLFAQRFVEPSTNPPDEFFREVGRDDPWIQTLLCAAQPDNWKDTKTFGFDVAPSNLFGSQFLEERMSFKRALPNTAHPEKCPGEP
jgi:hypothetical protein